MAIDKLTSRELYFHLILTIKTKHSSTTYFENLFKDKDIGSCYHAKLLITLIYGHFIMKFYVISFFFKYKIVYFWIWSVLLLFVLQFGRWNTFDLFFDCYTVPYFSVDFRLPTLAQQTALFEIVNDSLIAENVFLIIHILLIFKLHV